MLDVNVEKVAKRYPTLLEKKTGLHQKHETEPETKSACRVDGTAVFKTLF